MGQQTVGQLRDGVLTQLLRWRDTVDSMRQAARAGSAFTYSNVDYLWNSLTFEALADGAAYFLQLCDDI